jgi:DNA-binding protein HU-beta
LQSPQACFLRNAQKPHFFCLRWQCRTENRLTHGFKLLTVSSVRGGVSFSKSDRGKEQQMARVMTKSQVVSHLAEKAGIQKKVAAAVLEEIAALATKECKSSGQFVIPGLGKAVKANRKARVGRNPQTGEPIKIPAKTVVKFRLAKAFKDAVVPPKKK